MLPNFPEAMASVDDVLDLAACRISSRLDGDPVEVHTFAPEEIEGAMEALHTTGRGHVLPLYIELQAMKGEL
jgi:hypothetical protein